MKQTLLFIVITLAISSCKKIASNIEDTSNTNPIYQMSGLIDNEAFDYTVDNETVLMTSGSESMNNVPAFYAVFEDSENETSIKLSIIAPERILKKIGDYSVADKNIPFLVHSKGCYNLGFSTTPPNPPIIMFSLNGEPFIGGEELEVPGYGLYDIPVRFKGLSNETYSFTLNHGFTAESFNANFELTKGLANIKFESNALAGQHQWFLNGQFISQSASGVTGALDGINTITHILTDDMGNTCAHSHIFYAESNVLKWVFETTACELEQPSSNFEELIITYKEGGTTYSSAFAEENRDLTLSIKNIEYFIEPSNVSGISFKFDAEFNGVLYNEDKSKKKNLTDVIGTCKFRIE